MPRIVLATINARYIHAAFGLRCLRANLGELRNDCEIVELTNQDRPVEIAEKLLRRSPEIIGLGVYVWNARETRDLVSILKAAAPHIPIVLGGPEVSYETDRQALCELADFVVTGEGEVTFKKLCERLLGGGRPLSKVHPGEPPDLTSIELPYGEYTDDDIKNRFIYVEASRGCPYRCEFCLSALDERVRNVPLSAFLGALDSLFTRGVRHFKFVDRTFNLNIKTAEGILDFFLERYEPGLELHFEMIPDRFPERLRDRVAKFPAGSLQFEIGIQTFNPKVAATISRKQDYEALRSNLRYLRDETHVHMHADLIVGLPGETLESFAEGFDTLLEMGPHEIQVGILKRLRGAPIIRHTDEFSMVYSDRPPYEVLQTSVVDFPTMQRLKRFAHLWDRVANSGNFVGTAPTLWRNGSPFTGFLAFTDWVHGQTGRMHGIALDRLAGLLHRYAITELMQDAADVESLLAADYARSGRRIPNLLQSVKHNKTAEKKRLKRQARHWAGAN